MYVNLRTLTLSHHHLLLELPTAFTVVSVLFEVSFWKIPQHLIQREKISIFWFFSLKFPIAEVQPYTNQFPLCHLSRGQRVAFGGVEQTPVASAKCQCWLVLDLVRLGPRQLGLYSLYLKSVKKRLIF